MAHRLPCQPATAAAATATTRPEGNGPPPSISSHRGAWRPQPNSDNGSKQKQDLAAKCLITTCSSFPQWQLGKLKPNNLREYRGQRTRGPVLLLKA
ncbi:hypothetical protein NEUTE1DRAFT_102329 [Neurospora tetrasperma FGSC 2508]|uniref:Uncharacterized protein n=1 Tax=Neurospora tetrasperma (strain FGSC 2508 / ATCC MYA-4615 / P0657) TaxID=510951 RepID=F8MP82_NEUT8|nr:uncharacterized protein NEUTE1DRAFT_102329 [Neurospora tetrasperma FGSC 2508]EGO57094.1 hypothetical protein NEUTE1DRAFT_102329 [Neurospora tetrasperma FGSC 2508]EGZ69990.1 hypothetical protein NEUTE2DRAFT_67753 [Neurospora tetrasperma FGSC 2509]